MLGKGNPIQTVEAIGEAVKSIHGDELKPWFLRKTLRKELGMRYKKLKKVQP